MTTIYKTDNQDWTDLYHGFLIVSLPLFILLLPFMAAGYIALYCFKLTAYFVREPLQIRERTQKKTPRDRFQPQGVARVQWRPWNRAAVKLKAFN